MGVRDKMSPKKKDIIYTHDEIKERRAGIANNASKRRKILKGDRRVTGDKQCSICQRKLSTSNLETGDTQATIDYLVYTVGEFEITVCANVANCYTIHDERLRRLG